MCGGHQSREGECEDRAHDGANALQFGALDGSLAAGVPFSDSFSCLPGLNLADRLAEISMDSPVLGLRPVRASRVETANVPKPEMFTRSPALSAVMISSS